jgi:hypothetical protein
MDEQLDVVVVAKVARDLREWLRYKAYLEERTMSSIIRDMLDAARREERANVASDQREALAIERSRRA